MKKLLLIAAFITLSLNNSNAQMTTRVIAEDLFIPWELVYGPDGHIWFTQKNGYICRVDPATKQTDTLYFESNTVIQNEGGMLGMVLHPDFQNNPYVYVAYNYSQSGYKERIARYTYNSSSNTLSNPTTLLEGIDGTNIHNGCRMIIVNNQLYITTGDAANQSIAQDVNALNGKTLRINLDGSLPTDNPVANSPVWSWGHRNAQGLVYANNKFYSSEHGPSNDDELNILQKGRNFGWPNVHGYCDAGSEQTFCNDSNVVEPIMAWTPTLAVSGIDYYDHPMFPALKNSVLMTTLKNKNLYQLQLNTAGDQVMSSSIISQVGGDRLRAICIDPDGRIYVSTSNSSASGASAKVDKIIEIYDPSYSSIAQRQREAGEAVSVFPNPAQNNINIYVNPDLTKQPLMYTISDINGRTIFSNMLVSGNNSLNIQTLATGVYILNVSNGNRQVSSTKFNKL